MYFTNFHNPIVPRQYCKLTGVSDHYISVTIYNGLYWDICNIFYIFLLTATWDNNIMLFYLVLYLISTNFNDKYNYHYCMLLLIVFLTIRCHLLNIINLLIDTRSFNIVLQLVLHMIYIYIYIYVILVWEKILFSRYFELWNIFIFIIIFMR